MAVCSLVQCYLHVIDRALQFCAFQSPTAATITAISVTLTIGTSRYALFACHCRDHELHASVALVVLCQVTHHPIRNNVHDEWSQGQ
jgi:hypothetical protein